MAIKVQGTYVFDVVGDGVSTEILIPLRALANPSILKNEDYIIPTEVIDANTSGGTPIGVTPKLEGEFLRLIFVTPPPASALKVSVNAKFGTERV